MREQDVNEARRGAAAGLALLLACACGPSPAPARASEGGGRPGPLHVVAVNRPLAVFAERIGGETVRVECPAPPGTDPAFWRPSREEVAAIQAADLVLRNGAGYAKWVEQVSLPLAAQVDTSRAFRDRLLPAEEATTHRHGPEGEHSHGELAFTTWLDPALARQQARAVAAALERERPDDAERFAAGLAALEADLSELDRRLARAFEGAGPLLASHPVYAYLARAQGLELESLHLEPDEPPTEADWDAIARSPARVMLWEAEPLPATRARLAELGVRVAVYAPRGGSEGDVVAGWLADARALERILREER